MLIIMFVYFRLTSPHDLSTGLVNNAVKRMIFLKALDDTPTDK